MTFSRLWTIARLELLQRVHTVSWYVLLGVFGLVLLGVTALAFLAYGGWGTGGPGVYSVVVYVTLLLILLVSPTLSGNSINGDRDAATLAPVQVTLATAGEILFGKFLAAWITGLAFAAVAAPFLGWMKSSVRTAQIPPQLESTWDECDPKNDGYYGGSNDYRTPEETVAQTVPSWFVGLAVQLALTGLLLWWAWARTRTPVRSLPRGTRIA